MQRNQNIVYRIISIDNSSKAQYFLYIHLYYS
nr:MAG TPA: hypothetical protein [Caudoviricetes sp.]